MPSIDIGCPKTDTPFGEIFYPGLIAEILLVDVGFQAFEFILDSGADCTVVPHYMATLTGVKLPRKASSRMTGVSGKSMACYQGRLTMRISDQQFEVRCLFTASNRTPLLLGRVDFFNIFQILFDGTANCNISLTRN